MLARPVHQSLPASLQHDDAIKEDTHELMRSVTDGVVANGCPAVATMFTTSQGTGALWRGCCVLGAAVWRLPVLRLQGGVQGLCLAATVPPAAVPLVHTYLCLPATDCELLMDLYKLGYEIAGAPGWGAVRWAGGHSLCAAAALLQPVLFPAKRPLPCPASIPQP